MATKHQNTGASRKAELSPNSFDTLAQSRSRSTRAASLALPNNVIVNFLEDSLHHHHHQQQQSGASAHLQHFPNANQPHFKLAPPSASSINIRRHSSHHCQIIDKVSEEQLRLQTLPVLPSAPSAKPVVMRPPPEPQPPPVPKRNFKKSPGQLASPNLMFDPVPEASPTVVAPVDFRRRQGRKIVQANCELGTARYGSVNGAQSSDDDLLNMDSPVFVEHAPQQRNGSTTSVGTNPFLTRSSNRSSGDSTKSQATIDTGYMTEPTAGGDRIFFGESVDVFRGRFSSVDTQSSIDSGCTDITKCMSPPSSCGLPPTPSAPPLTGSSVAPAVPKRRQKSFPRIPPPASRGAGPPVPPARTGLDSPRMLQNSGTNGGGAAGGLAHELYSQPAAIVRKLRHHPARVTQRQDSTLSSDSFTASYSPGFSSKGMEQPLLPQRAVAAQRAGMAAVHKSSAGGGGSGGGTMRHASLRQNSTISSDSVSVTSSPGYNTQLIESPLIAHTDKLHTSIVTGKRTTARLIEQTLLPPDTPPPSSPIIKSMSTPGNLQTYVRFHHAGSNASLHHHNHEFNRRKSSSPYITHPKLNGRTIQVGLNVCVVIVVFLALLVLICRSSAPVRSIIVQTVNTTPKQFPPHYYDMNPAPGVCLPVIVKFCEAAPYNYTVFPNYIGHFGQLDAEEELEAYDALVDVQCSELASLFLCTLFAPKCGSNGQAVAPCKSLCEEATYRCGFFFDVFGLGLPDYLNCNILTDSTDSDVCVGWHQVQDARRREENPPCSAFQCDNKKRCIPMDWRCDGHSDCKDQTDEQDCAQCPDGGIFCGGKFCLKQSYVCDGIVHCPFGQDERNCVRLSERFGDVGQGVLEVFKPQNLTWMPACVNNWDKATSPSDVCSLLGYNAVNSTNLTLSMNRNLEVEPTQDTVGMWRMAQSSQMQRNLLKSFNNCTSNTNYMVAHLTCSNFECGRIRTKRMRRPKTRIVGGKVSSPGDWPFIAAILGGPKEIFYCAGVLISDQWVLTASHCVGNHTLRNINDFTIQLGITRRHSYSYYGEMVKVRRVIPHPQYNSDIIHDNDIALFQLATRVAFHEHIMPVCLPSPRMRELKPGTECTVIGWGKKELRKGSAAYEPTINEVVVPVMNREVCNEWLVQLNVTEGMICAGYPEGGKDACQGDSGGPLLCREPEDKARWFVGGIVSWGVKCAHPKLPGVYANVPKYLPWITAQMQKYSKG